MPRCHVCGSFEVHELVGSTRIVGVSSDCVPLGSGQQLAACLACGTIVTILDDAWRDLCEGIYAGYVAYRQALGSEDRVFTGKGASQGRSRQIIDLCAPALPGTTGRWLDFGCGNGTFLRSVSERFPGRQLVGLEFDDHTRDDVLGIPGVLDLITSWDSDVAEDLSVISMIHVLEHIEDPGSLLRTVWERLAPGGALIVQVPHIWTNPYALTVSDHATHFGAASLSRLIQSAGFDIAWTGIDEVPGELTVVARRSTGLGPDQILKAESPETGPESAGRAFDARLPQHLVDRLVATAEWLAHQREANGTLGILGTSIAGTWAAATINLEFDLWVDEDPARAGLEWLGKRVYSPIDVPSATKVLAVLAPDKARPAAERLMADYAQFTVVLPPAFGELFKGSGFRGW